MKKKCNWKIEEKVMHQFRTSASANVKVQDPHSQIQIIQYLHVHPPYIYIYSSIRISPINITLSVAIAWNAPLLCAAANSAWDGTNLSTPSSKYVRDAQMPTSGSQFLPESAGFRWWSNLAEMSPTERGLGGNKIDQ